MQNAAVLSILVNAKTGQATAALRKTQGQLKQTEKAAGRTGRGFKGLSSNAKLAIGSAAGAGILGLGAAAKSSVGAFRESQRVTKQTAAVLKSTGHAAGVSAKQVADLATQLSRKTGIDDEAIQSTENLLLTFTKIKSTGGIFKETTTLALDMSKALGQNFKSSAIQLGKALNDPVKGITALKRVGVDFDASAKKRIERWVEEGKVMKAQKFILAEVRKEFGGSAAAQATAMDKLKVTLGNVSEAIGGRLVPWIDKGAAGFNRFITGMQNGTGAGGQFVTVLRNIGTAFMAVVAPLASVVAKLASFGFSFLQTKAGVVALSAVLGALAGRLVFLAGAFAVAKVIAFVSAIGSAVTAIRTAIAVTTSLRGAMALLTASMAATGWGAVLVAIGAIAGAFLGFNNRTSEAKTRQDAFRAALNSTKEAFDQYRNAIDGVKDSQLAQKTASLNLSAAEANLKTLQDSGTASALQIKQAKHEVALATREVERADNASATAQVRSREETQKAIATLQKGMPVLAQRARRESNTIQLYKESIRQARASGASQARLRELTEGLNKAQGQHNRTIARVNSRLKELRNSTIPASQKLLIMRGILKNLTDAGLGSTKQVKALRAEINRLESKNIKVSATVEVVNNVTGAIKDAVADAFDFSGGTGGAKDYGTGASGTKGPVEATIGAIVNHQMETADWKKILGPAMEGGMGGVGGGSSTLRAYKGISAAMGLSAGTGQGQGFRPGDPGWHGKNRAFDSSGPTGSMMRFARYMFSHFGGSLLELIYTPMGKAIKNGQAVAPYAKDDHHDHVHVAAAKGAAIKSHRATSPTVLFGEEAPRHPEYFISTNPRDKKRSTGLLAQAAQEISGKRLAQFKKGGRRYPGAGFNWAYKNYPAHGGGGAALSEKQVRQVAEMAGFSPGRAVQMAQIARGESTYRPGADGGMYGTPGPAGYGLWQITPGAWGGNGNEAIYRKFHSLGSRKGMFTPIKNAKMAKFMYGQSGFGPWVGTQYLDRGMNVSGVSSVLGRNARSGGGGGGEPASPMSKRNRKILKRIPKRLKKIKGIGLSKKQEGWLKFLTNSGANFGEWGSRAGQLSSDDAQGKVGGQNEAFWTKRQLESLFALRNTLIRYEELIVKKRERMKKMIGRAKKFLRKLERHPKRNRPLIKAYKSKLIPAMKKRRSGLNTRRGELLSSLEEVQGIASPMGVMGKLPPIGTLGGQIFAAQTRLRELGTKTSDISDSSPAAVDTESADLLRQLLQQSRMRELVGQNEIANLPFAGSFAKGGIVPGRGPMAAVVHGGEAIGQPGAVSVQVFVHPGGQGADVYVNEKKVEAVVEKVTRNMARKVGRAPGARG